MDANNTSHSLSGSWRGHYTYAGGKGSYGFEAVFIENNGAVEGNILDDGRLGEAGVYGVFTYPKLEFTKNYYSAALHAVKYQGLMSEDGNTLTGTWNIMKTQYGTWVAKRYTDAKELDLETLDSDQSKTEQKELVSTSVERSK